MNIPQEYVTYCGVVKCVKVANSFTITIVKTSMIL